MKIFGISLRLRKTSLNYVLLSHVQLYGPIDCSLPGSSVHRIFQATILDQVAIPYSRVSSRPRGALLYMNFMISDIWSFFMQKVSNLEYYLIWQHSLSNADCAFVFDNIHLSVAF